MQAQNQSWEVSNEVPAQLSQWQVANEAPAPDAGNPVIRFLKAAGSKYLGSTLLANPVEGGSLPANPAENARQMNPATRTPLSQIIQDSSLSNMGSNAIEGVKSLNPIAVDRMQSGDVAGGMGESAMNLLLIRQMFKGKGLPVGGASAVPGEFSPMGNYTKVQPQVSPRALPPAPAEPIPLGASSLDIAPATREGLLPAKSQMVSDGQGGLKKQYLTSVNNKPPTTNYTLDQGKLINNLRAELERIGGTSIEDQQAVDQRMAQYARTPWESETPVPVNETPFQKYDRLRRALQPQAQSGKITVYPDPNANTSMVVQGKPVAQAPPRQIGNEMQYAMEEGPMNEKPQLVGNEDLTDALTKSIAKVMAQKARAARAGRK